MNATQEKNAGAAAVTGAIESVKESISGGVDAAKTKMSEGYEKVAETAKEVWDKAADTSVHDVEVKFSHFVRRNPGKCLLLAAGAGIVLGILVRGRFR